MSYVFNQSYTTLDGPDLEAGCADEEVGAPQVSVHTSSEADNPQLTTNSECLSHNAYLPRGLLDDDTQAPASSLVWVPNPVVSSPDAASTRSHACSTVLTPARATRFTKARYGRDRNRPDAARSTRSRVRTITLLPMELDDISSSDDHDDMDISTAQPEDKECTVQDLEAGSNSGAPTERSDKEKPPTFWLQMDC